MKNEKNTKQNPLGIIAIFASLAEIFGTVVLKFLPLEIQRIFVWHVMLFPTILIFFFFYILYKKPLHFYSPDYYKDEKIFQALMQGRLTLDTLEEEIQNSSLSNQEKENITNKILSVKENLEFIEAKNAKESLSIIINGTEIVGTTVKDFYRNIFEYLDDNHIDYQSQVPFKTGKIRYLIHTKNCNQNGAKFLNPLLYKNYYIETNKSLEQAKRDIYNFLKALGLHVEF